MAELVDALGSGPSEVATLVEVRVLSWAPLFVNQAHKFPGAPRDKY
jgi:hypothetical protein